MALKITLKPHERIVIGGGVVRNGGTRSDLVIENSVPVLREKDIMNEQDAVSPCRRLYFIIQLMYIDEKNLVEYHETYWKLVKDIISAAPRTMAPIDQISEHILCGRYYQALKIARKLIDFEQEVVKRCTQPR
jgi:flagellar protein FlbT